MSLLTDMITNNALKILESTDLSALDNKTLLVTGASGLIGIHMITCLREVRERVRPKKIYALVNREPLSFIRELLDFEGVQVLRGDLTNTGFCESLPAADCIIHAACYGQPIRFMEDPIKTLKLNTLTTFSLLEKLEVGGKFLFISTSEVYTGLSDPPFAETQIGTTDPGHPRACYIEAKRCGEAIVNVCRSKGADAKSARLALAYGPGTRMGDKRVISEFIQRGFDKEIRLMDQGAARRAYCYVTDAVELMWKILISGRESVYNVGGVSERSIAQLAQTIGDMMNASVVFPDTPQEVKGGPMNAWVDMTRANTEFGKKEYVSLEDGLAQTIEWYRVLRAS
ncbi:MAG: NAD-dependent epimerase/dehydratase family protein [Burkholderiales bacterium]